MGIGKQHSRYIQVGVILACLCTGLRAQWKPNDAQQEALEAVNAIRTELGLPHYTMDERLCKAATAHSKYVDGLKTRGHYETKGVAGFTGVTPGDRARAAGYPWDVSEVVNYRLNIFGITNTVRELFDAPYHRAFFLQRGRGEMGAGCFGRTLTIDFCVWLNEGHFLHPMDGQKDVFVSWDRGENPDPRRIGKLPKAIGYPIYFRYETSPRQTITISAATLTDAAGRSVPVFVNSPDNDDHLKNWKTEALILPVRPLSPKTTYTVKVAAKTDTGRDISKEWKYTTGGLENANRRDSQAEEALNISFTVDPGVGNSANARVLNLDKDAPRVFTLKARNILGDLLATTKLRLAPSGSGSVVLNAKEPIQSVVLVPDGKFAGRDTVTRMLAVRFRQ